MLHEVVAALPYFDGVHTFFEIDKHTAHLLQALCLQLVVTGVQRGDTAVLPEAVCHVGLQCIDDVGWRYVQEARDLHHLLVLSCGILKCIVAAEKLESYAALMAEHGENLDRADLAGGQYMRATAGAEVGTTEVDDAYIARERLLRAVVDRLQLFRGRPDRGHTTILEDDGIGLLLDGHQLLPAERTVEIDGHHVTHVEADIVIAIVTVHEAGHDMLPGVVPTVAHATRPVDDAVNRLADRQRPVHGMQYADDDIAPCIPLFFTAHRVGHRQLLHIQHGGLTDGTVVRILATALRIEAMDAELDEPVSVRGGAARHLRVELLHIMILIIKCVFIH